MGKKQNVPALRFPGFSGEWEKYNLSMLSGVITKGTTPLDKSGRGDVNFIKIENIDANTGAIHVTQKISQEEHNGYLKRSQLKENDILFSIAGTLGRVAVVKANLLPANTNQALAIIRLKKGSFQYIKTYLQGKAVENFLKANPTVGAQPNLSLAQVGDLEVVMPEESKEQENISDFFQYWDELIFHTMAKIKRLQQFRKAMLTKLFPREGEAEPELRFRGFYNKWTIESFENLVSRVSIMDNDPALPHVEYEDIISGAGTLNKDIYKKSSSKTGIKFSIGDVLYGKLRPYLKNWLFATFPGIAVGDFWVLHPEKVAGKFLYYLIQSTGYQNLANMTTGTKMPRADWAVISKAKFIVPNDLAEQERIGDFLYQLDSYISLQQKKLERMQRLKAALLEKLFV